MVYLKVDGEMKVTCLIKPLEGSSVVAKCILLIWWHNHKCEVWS